MPGKGKRLPSVTSYDFSGSSKTPSVAATTIASAAAPPPRPDEKRWKLDDPEFYNYSRVSQQVVETEIDVKQVWKALGQETKPCEEKTPAQKMEKMLALLRRLQDDEGGFYASHFDKMPSRFHEPAFYNGNQNPLCFSKIKAMLRSGAYKSLDHFFKDIDMLLQRGLDTSDPDAPKHIAAQKLLSLAQICVSTILGDVVEGKSNTSLATFSYLSTGSVLHNGNDIGRFETGTSDRFKEGDCVGVNIEKSAEAPDGRIFLHVTEVGIVKEAGSKNTDNNDSMDVDGEVPENEKVVLQGRVLIPFTQASRPIWDLHRSLQAELLLSDIVRFVDITHVSGHVTVVSRDVYMTQSLPSDETGSLFCCSLEYLHRERATRPLLAANFNVAPGQIMEERSGRLAIPEMPKREVMQFDTEKDIVISKNQDGASKFLLEQVGLSVGVVVLGDAVLIRATSGEPMIVKVTGIEKGETGECIVFGKRYVRPEETMHHPKRLFLDKEVMLSHVTECFCCEAIIRKCWVVPIDLYVLGFPLGTSTDFIFVCEYTYDPDGHVFQHEPHVQRRFQSSKVLCDQFCIFKEPVYIRRRVASPYHDDPVLVHTHRGLMPDYGVRPFVPPGTVVSHGGWRPRGLCLSAREKAKSYGIVEAHLDSLVFNSGRFLLECPHVTAMSLFAEKVRPRVRDLFPSYTDEEVERTVRARFAGLDGIVRMALEQKAVEEMDLWKVEEARARIRVNAKIGQGSELTTSKGASTLSIPRSPLPDTSDPTTVKAQVKKLYDPKQAREEARRCGEAEGKAMFQKISSFDPSKGWTAQTATIFGQYTPFTQEMNINDIDSQIAVTLAQGDAQPAKPDVVLYDMLDPRMGVSLKRLQRHVFRTELMHRQQWAAKEGEALRQRVALGQDEDAKPAATSKGPVFSPDPKKMEQIVKDHRLSRSQFGIGTCRPEPQSGSVAYALGGAAYAERVPSSLYQLHDHSIERQTRKIVRIALNAERAPGYDWDEEDSDSEFDNDFVVV